MRKMGMKKRRTSIREGGEDAVNEDDKDNNI